MIQSKAPLPGVKMLLTLKRSQQAVNVFCCLRLCFDICCIFLMYSCARAHTHHLFLCCCFSLETNLMANSAVFTAILIKMN